MMLINLVNMRKKVKKEKDDNKAQEAHEAIRPTDITKIDIGTGFDSKEVKCIN